MNDATTSQKQQMLEQRILDLTQLIAKLADGGAAANARDIAAAARTIQTLVWPSAADDLAELVVRLAPHVPSGDRVETTDGRLVKGVSAIEVTDAYGEQRVAKITVRGVAVYGA